MGRTKIALANFLVIVLFSAFFCSSALAVGIKVVPSSQRVLPGEEFYFDIVTVGIPAEGLGGAQFRLNMAVPGGTVSGVADLGQAGAGEVAVASPLLISPPTATRSGIGDFFWNGRGSNGILVMDNEPLVNGSALYTFAHTNGSTPPSGSGSMARFMVRVGSGVSAKQINISLSEVMLLDGGPFYPLDYNTGATVQIGCFTRMPDLAGLSLVEATARLAQSQLLVGSTYEIDNAGGIRPLNLVLEQSASAGSELLCEAAVNLAVNVPPAEVAGGSAADKAGDDSGAVALTWTPSPSADTAGYRIYLGSALLVDIPNPAANGADIGGLATGVTSQLQVTAYDTHGNESQGATIGATPLDDVAPVVTIGGVTEGSYYRSDVTPQVAATDTNLAETVITLNGNPYSPAPITADGAYTLSATGTDRFGNQTTKSVHFTMDKTAPVITIAGVADGGAYNTDITPVISVADTNFKGSSVVLNGQPYVLGNPVTAEGNYSLSVAAEDLAGNSASLTVTFIIDKTSPVSSAEAATPRYASGDVLFVSGQTPVTASAQDAGIAPSGVAGMEYRLDDAQGWSAYGAPVAFAGLADGVHTFNYRAFDRATNVETFHAFTATVDNTPPESVLTVGDPKFTSAAGENFATRDSLFTVTATDNLSGVAAIQLKLDSGSWGAFVPFTLSGEGVHTFQYRSQDNLTNEETARSFTVTIDNTPPVTVITPGTPRYEEGGDIHVTSGTSFILSATDNLSGTATTEYRIDNGPWTPYAPFTISGEGSHDIGYRSMDNLGNQEAEKVLGVIVDNTPPVSALSVGSPQYLADGTLYVSGRTELTISATDNDAGVQESEFGFDQPAFSAYAGPFNLASLTDGGHSIFYRSIDNLANSETVKHLDLVLDKTPPTTVITASDPLMEGAVNTVAPTTAFSLAASDDLSGVKGIWYRIDGGQWQIFSAGFTLAGMNAGTHTISFSATDNVGNDETERSIKVRLVLMEVSKGISLEPVVLVGAWTDNLNLVRNQGAIDALEPILSALGINYHIAGDGDDLKRSLRSGRYNTYILVDYKDEKVGGEIREAVNYGDSLIFIKTRPSADPALDEVFGVKFTGKTTSDNLMVNLQESPLSQAGTMQSTGKSVVGTVSADTASVFGYVNDSKGQYPAVVFNEYGDGKSVLFTFDLPNSADKEKAADLVGNSITLLKPERHNVRALDSLPLRIKVAGSTEPLGLRVTETLPAGTTADTVMPQGTATDTTIIWQQYLGASVKAEFGYYLNLPDAKGEYTATTDIEYANYGAYRLYETTGLTANVPNNSVDLLQAVVTELNAIPAADSNDLAILTDALGMLSQVTTVPQDGKEAEKGVEAVIKVTRLIRGLTADTAAVRLKLDELLKVLERKWYLMIGSTP